MSSSETLPFHEQTLRPGLRVSHFSFVSLAENYTLVSISRVNNVTNGSSLIIITLSIILNVYRVKKYSNSYFLHNLQVYLYSKHLLLAQPLCLFNIPENVLLYEGTKVR